MKPVIFLNSHPIQYFAPLYKEICNTTNIDLQVWYCSDESIRGGMDKGFNEKVKWDIPLLEGYKYLFFKNYSWKKSVSRGFMGLINFGVISKLFHQPKSIVIVHGWNYATHLITIFFGKMFGHTICLRAETPHNQELLKPKLITALKHIYLRFLFLLIDKFLYIGTENKKFYSSLGVKEKNLFPLNYCVDNDRFHHLYLATGKAEARALLGLNPDKKIILYSGKYITKKRPMDLLAAFVDSNHEEARLIFVGEGNLRGEMQQFIEDNKLQADVVLTGFVNQSKIPLYYRAADIFVMCSGMGETWGLSVNEAMNFALPVIVSDMCGCSVDLVEDEVNGAIFKTGNVKQLEKLVTKFIAMTPDEIQQFARAALEKIDNYSYSRVISQLKKVVA